MRRKFDPEATLSLAAQHEATTLAVVPVMLQRILELPIDTIQKYDLSALRVNVDTHDGKVALYGSAPSEDARQRAERIAMAVKGVSGVDNKLAIETAQVKQ
jgi:hypothetical protein